MCRSERIQILCGSFDLITSELAKAKQRFRKGDQNQAEIDYLRQERHEITTELAILDELADTTEPDIDAPADTTGTASS